jgi:hypothetical protein
MTASYPRGTFSQVELAGDDVMTPSIHEHEEMTGLAGTVRSQYSFLKAK